MSLFNYFCICSTRKLTKVCMNVIRFVPTPPSPSVRRHVPLPLQHHRSLSESNGELPSSRFAPFRVADPPPMSPRYQATPPDWERSRLYRYFSDKKLIPLHVSKIEKLHPNLSPSLIESADYLSNLGRDKTLHFEIWVLWNYLN